MKYITPQKGVYDVIITVGGARGGSGKTGLVFFLYKELIDRGCKVAVMDLDGQQNITKALHKEGLGTLKKGDLMKLKDLEKDYDYILVDTHPVMDKITALAFYLSDILIVPSRPDGYIFNTYDRTAEQLELSHNKARTIRVVTMYQKTRTLHKKILGAVKAQYGDVIVFPLSSSWEDSHFFNEKLPKKSPCREPLEQLLCIIKEN